MYQKYTGIILKKYPVNEADELLTIYTREAGKIRVMARSTHKILSKLAGSLQSLNEIEFETAHRSSGGGGLSVLISVRPRAINNYLRENLKKFAYALVGVETLYRLSPDGQTNSRAYESLVSFLERLGKTSEENLQVRMFQLELLEISGFRLETDQCWGCSNRFVGHALFIVEKGGIFCGRCFEYGKSDLFLGGEELKELKLLSSGQAVSHLLPAVGTVIDGFLKYVLEREIKSSRFVQTLNQES